MRTLVVLLTAVGLSACASNSSQAPSASVAPSALPPSGVGVGFDACTILPATELSQIIGGEIAITTAIPSGGWGAGQCAWNSPSSTFILRIGTAATITAFGDPTAPNAKAMLAVFKQRANAAGTTKEVAETGDGAVLGTSGMAAYVGGTYLEVTRLRLTDEQLIEIMRLAVANL